MTPFETERSLDPLTGEIRLTIRYKGEQCIQGILPGPMAKSYVGFVSILKDLEDVLALIQAAQALLPPPSERHATGSNAIAYADIPPNARHAIKAHYFAAIALYGRCFVSASGGRGTTLNDDHVGASFKAIHSHVMGFRHGLVAHAGDAFDDGQAIVAWTALGDEYSVEANIRRLECEDDRQLEPNFEALVRHLVTRVDAKQRELSQRLIDGQAKQLVIAWKAALTEDIGPS